MTWFSFWRTDQQASRESPLVIGWHAGERSYVVTDAVRRCPL